MEKYGDYFLEYIEVFQIIETNELEFTYEVIDSEDDFICEIRAYADGAGNVRFGEFYISVIDVKCGDINEFVDFLAKNLTHARMLGDIGLKLECPINDDGILDPPSAAA